MTVLRRENIQQKISDEKRALEKVYLVFPAHDASMRQRGFCYEIRNWIQSSAPSALRGLLSY